MPHMQLRQRGAHGVQDTDVNKLVQVINYVLGDDETTNVDGHFGTKLAQVGQGWTQAGFKSENKPNRTNKGAVGTSKDTKIVTSLKLATPTPRLSSFSQGFLFMTWSTFIPLLFMPFSDFAVCNDI